MVGEGGYTDQRIAAGNFARHYRKEAHLYMVITSSGMVSWKETREEAEAVVSKCLRWAEQAIKACQNDEHKVGDHREIVILAKVESGVIMRGILAESALPQEMRDMWREGEVRPDPEEAKFKVIGEQCMGDDHALRAMKTLQALLDRNGGMIVLPIIERKDDEELN